MVELTNVLSVERVDTNECARRHNPQTPFSDRTNDRVLARMEVIDKALVKANMAVYDESEAQETVDDRVG